MSTAEPGEQQLSAKDLKAKKKAEKAAKRAAAKESAGLPPRSDKPDQRGKDGGKKQDNSATTVAEQFGAGFVGLKLFAHLERSGETSTVPHKDVHPSILHLTVQYASYKILGSSARCKAMLLAFKDVINEYHTPPGTSLGRSLTLHLGHQIDYLKTARPLSISMGNAIRWLKLQISGVSIDLSDIQARALLCEQIDTFIRDKIDIADQVIVETAVNHIQDGDVVLTYARSNVVRQILVRAHEIGKKFRVVVVDSRPLYEGKVLAKELVAAGIDCTYVLIGALSYIMKDVTTVFLGAHAMVSNGHLLSRVGTAIVATAAKSRNIAVLVLCETVKFTERVQLDSVTFNELANPKQLAVGDSGEDLNLLNILYDLTSQSMIKKVITEVGSLPASSVPVIMREYKSFQ
jgi:translation initiation factor eIF-2B subunit delta